MKLSRPFRSVCLFSDEHKEFDYLVCSDRKKSANKNLSLLINKTTNCSFNIYTSATKSELYIMKSDLLQRLEHVNSSNQKMRKAAGWLGGVL